jgi:hypothetical protein
MSPRRSPTAKCSDRAPVHQLVRETGLQILDDVRDLELSGHAIGQVTSTRSPATSDRSLKNTAGLDTNRHVRVSPPSRLDPEMGPIDTTLVAEYPWGLGTVPFRFSPSVDSETSKAMAGTRSWTGVDRRRKAAAPSPATGSSWSSCFRLTLMGVDVSWERTSWELMPGPRADARDPADPGTVIRSQPGARRGPMPTIHARHAFRLHAGQLLSQTLGGLAHGAGTAAADADRRGDDRPRRTKRPPAKAGHHCGNGPLLPAPSRATRRARLSPTPPSIPRLPPRCARHARHTRTCSGGASGSGRWARRLELQPPGWWWSFLPQAPASRRPWSSSWELRQRSCW